MNRTLTVLLAVALTTSALAADTQRYLVATRHHGITANVRQMLGEDGENRAVVPFETWNGFGAELTAAEVASLRASAEVRWVEPVRERHKFAQARNPLHQTVPFGLQTIFAPPAQAGFIKGTINVVVIDTGVDYHHPDLQAAWAGGRNVLNDIDDPMDDDSHGTHVAGTIAAADNGFGVVGVAPKVRLWGVKVLNGQGTGDTLGVIKGLDWVAAKKDALGGNWVINLSLGAYEESPGEREAFQKIRDKGILVIAAAGNLSTADTPGVIAFPAAYPSVIAVGATTFDRKLAYFSGQGPELDLAAPGVDVLSTIPAGLLTISYLADNDVATIAPALLGSKQGVITGEFVYCGTGKVGDFPHSVAGKIALVKRGDSVSFRDKTRNAKDAGAIAVAIFDDEALPSSKVWTLLIADEDRTYDWPVTIRLTMQMGEALMAKGPHPITLANTADEYAEYNGTSMASPHVVGAAALIWSMAPDATAAQVVNALTATAIDLGAPGVDPQFGAGLINVNAAAHFLAPQAFGNITTGRPLGMRGRK
jgi:serine protease